MENLNIKHFSDYRSYLLAYVQDAKRANRRWTYGVWAKRLGLKDTSSITKIIQGKREAGKDISEKLSEFFNFNSEERRYFLDLIKLSKLKDDPRLSVLLLEKMGKEHPDANIREIDDRSFSIISNWYCLAIREMVKLNSFFEDPNWISKNFDFKVLPKEATRAIELLIDVNLLKRNEEGELEIIDGRFSTGFDYASEAIKRYHEQMLDNAKSSLRLHHLDEREFLASTISINSKNVPKAKELIRRFKDDFCKLIEEEEGDQLYQLQTQFFPLTKKQEVIHE